jgi:hypothetical protein
MRVVGILAVFMGGAVVGYLMLALGVVGVVDGMPERQEEPAFSLPTYLSFVSVMMTAVTAVLAAVAIGIGVIAAFTIREITERADKTVEEAKKKADATRADALALVEQALSDKAINARISRIVRATQNPTLAELEERFDPEDSGDR